MAKWTYENTRRGYLNLWRKLEIKGGDDDRNATRFAQKIVANEQRYRRVEAKTGVPWVFIGALHMRESSCNFDGVLHNGDKIIGTGKLTYRVPKGRGPFRTWEESAVDALRLKNLHRINDWCIERMGYEGERFNGLGYVGKGVNSAYLWAGSTLEQRGKYVADHVWDKDFDDPQLGIMTVLKRIFELRPDQAQRWDNRGPVIEVSPEAAESAAIEKEEATKPASRSTTNWAAGGIIAAVLGWLGTAAEKLGDLLTNPTFLVFAFVVLAAAYIVWERNRKPDISGWLRTDKGDLA